MKFFREVNNMLTLHEKQAEKYKAEGKEPVGFIKFNEYTNELVKGCFFLNSIEHFWQYGRDKIKDNSEGIIRLPNKKELKYTEILQDKAQAYLTSFTVVFADDFDKEGKIKETTVDKLLNKSENVKNVEKRNAVIFNLSLMDYIDTMGRNTPEFINREIKKPTMDDNHIQKFKTNNILCWQDAIYPVYQNFAKDSCKDFFNAIDSLKKKNLQGEITEKIFQKQNWFEEEKNQISIGFKGTYVYYDSKILDIKKDKILNEINKTKDIEVYEKYLAECFARKTNKYRDQHEYRLIFSEFKKTDTKENSIFPEGIKLEYHSNSNEWYAKEVKNSEVENLHLKDFKK